MPSMTSCSRRLVVVEDFLHSAARSTEASVVVLGFTVRFFPGDTPFRFGAIAAMSKAWGLSGALEMDLGFTCEQEWQFWMRRRQMAR